MGASVLDCYLELTECFVPLLSLFCLFIIINPFSQVVIIPVASLWIISCWTAFFSAVSKNWWKSFSCDFASIKHTGNTMMFPFSLPAWWLLILVPILIHYRHNILWKAVSACYSVICVWLLKMQYLALPSTEHHLFFFFSRTFL